MKLPCFLQNEGLNQLRARMGAGLIQWNSGITWTRIDTIEGEEIETFDDLVPLPDGTIVYKGERVAVYIRDQYRSREVASDPEKLYRVHVAECNTIQNMRRKDKFNERYVVTTRTDGKYVVNFLGQYGSDQTADGIECRLYVCMNCLKQLNYKNYNRCTPSESKEIKESFNLGDFFEEYGSRITNPPPHTDITAPPNAYTSDWPDVSSRLREQANWRCSECRDYFGDENMKRFLDVHHKYGLKYDNREQNLQVLCILCHAEIDERLKNSPRYAEYVQIKRETG